MVRAPRSSNPTSTHLPRCFGSEAEVPASVGARAGAAAREARCGLCVWAGLFGARSALSVQLPRCFGAGAGVSASRWAPGQATFAQSTFSGRSRFGEGPLADPTRSSICEPSRLRAKSPMPAWSSRRPGAGSSSSGRGNPSSLGLVSSLRTAVGVTGRHRFTVLISTLGPCVEARGIRPESTRMWIEVVSSRSRLTSGDPMSVATPACPVARSRSHGTRLPFPDKTRGRR